MNKVNKFCLFLFLSLFSCSLFGQNNVPSWVDNTTRNMRYADEVYYTGFTAVTVTQNKNLEKATAEAKQTVLGELTNRVLAAVSSSKSQVKVSIENNNKEQIYSVFSSDVSISSEMEIVGSKVETYFDEKSKIVYAFAYANKYELIGYYKSNLSVNINQIESFVKTAQDLERNNEKAKARQQLEQAKPLFSKVRYAQGLLIAIDGNATADDLQQTKTEQLYNLLTQMQAKLAQGVFVYVFGNENLFGKSENIIANKVKADLAHKGCSFVDSAEKADFRLKINADVRLSSQSDGMVFCYTDVEVELFDNHKQKAVFADSFSGKGGSSSQEKAGRKAMEEAANKIAEKLTKWIE